MPLVISSLGRGYTHTHTHTNTHTNNPHRINFKKPGVRRPAAARTWFKNILVYIAMRSLVMSPYDVTYL